MHDAPVSGAISIPASEDVEALKRELEAAEHKEREWLNLAVALARAKAPIAEVDAAWARHAQARQRTRGLFRRLNDALFS